MKKAITVKRKSEKTKPSLGQKNMSTTNKPKVYSLSKSSTATYANQYVTPQHVEQVDNIIIHFKISKKELNEIEDQITHESTSLLLEHNSEPMPFNQNRNQNHNVHTELLVTEEQNTTAADKGNESNNAFDKILKMKNKKTNLTTSTESKPGPSRKDLIINNGIQKKIKPALAVYSNGWPNHSPYACWLCCHTFNNTPVGIPERLAGNIFHLYGNFCSYNCGKRYLKGDISFDSNACLVTSHDYTVDDDKANRLQLLELLCHIETGLPISEEIKIAPPRLSLAMFGGTLMIEEFRRNFSQHSEYHVFKSPLVPIAYQIEETIDILSRSRGQKTTKTNLDMSRVEKTYNKLVEEKKQNNKFALEKIMGTRF